MRTYEALYIVRPDLSDDEIQTVAKRVESLVTDNGGSIVRSEIWGKRKLAYEVKHFTEGAYVLLRFEANPEFVAKLEEFFRVSEDVIRDLVVLFDEQTLKLEAEQMRRKEADIRSSRDKSDDDEDSPRPARSRARASDDDEEEEEE